VKQEKESLTVQLSESHA
jgi:hypothetical protein